MFIYLILIFFFFFFFFFFLGPYLEHTEVPRLRVELELQLLAYTIATAVTYTAAHSNTRSLTHWERPGIQPVSSWIPVGFVTAGSWRKLPIYFISLSKNKFLPSWFPPLYFSILLVYDSLSSIFIEFCYSFPNFVSWIFR